MQKNKTIFSLFRILKMEIKLKKQLLWLITTEWTILVAYGVQWGGGYAAAVGRFGVGSKNVILLNNLYGVRKRWRVNREYLLLYSHCCHCVGVFIEVCVCMCLVVWLHCCRSYLNGGKNNVQSNGAPIYVRI